MHMINNKGLSGLNASVLMILIGITSIYFIFASIQNISSQLSPEALSCTELNIKGPITTETTCFNSESSEIEVTINRQISSSDIEIFLLEFLAKTSSGELSWHCGPFCGGECILQDSGRKTFYIPAENPQTISLSLNSCPPSELITLTNCK